MTWDDFDREAKAIQEESAGDFDKIICRRVFSAVALAQRIAGVKSADTFFLTKIRGFDARPLVMMFKLMAPYWRYISGLRYPRLPGIGPSTEQLETDWYTWLHRELDVLCAEPWFMRPFIDASLYYDTAKGFDAEMELENFLRHRYRDMWTRKDAEALPSE
jgi:hypothetical protein